MTITTEEFITRFHSVSGATIGERRKNIFLLLNQIKQTESNRLNCSQLYPKTPLEEKWKVEALIYFKKIPDLLEVLKSENPILIERVLKVSWFLEEAFQNIAGEELVTVIFPHISFNAKLKLLNKLSYHLKNFQQADAYFEAVEKKYGLYLASKLLPACSPDVIINCIKFKRIKLTPRQVLVITKRNPEITETIFKLLSTKNVKVRTEYNSVFLYLAQHNTDLFFKLCIEYCLSLHLGWRKTNKFIQTNMQDVIENPNKYYRLLHNKQIPKSLNWNFWDLYRNLFPASLEQLGSNHQVFQMINKLPMKMRNVSWLFTTFEKVYGSQLWDHEKFYRNLSLFKLFPLSEQEKKLQLEFKPYGLSDDEWYSYMKIEKSVPYFKKTISLTSNIKTRAELVCLLIKTCHINGDKIALLNICRYMLTKHRNDDISVRKSFLATLKNNFVLEDLDEEHWTAINELIQLFTLNNETFAHNNEFLEGHIYFRLKHDMPVKEHLIEWLKLKTYSHTLNIIKQESRYEKQCLLTFGELIPELFGQEEEEIAVDEKDSREEKANLDRHAKYFVEALNNWNERHSEDMISIFSYPYVVSFIHRSIIKEKRSFFIATVIKRCLKLKIHFEERTHLLNLYLTTSADYMYDETIIKWAVQHSNSDEEQTKLLNLYLTRRAEDGSVDAKIIEWLVKHSNSEEEKTNLLNLYFTRSLIDDAYVDETITKWLVQQSNSVEEKSNLLNLYLCIVSRKIRKIMWFIQHEPLTINHSIDVVTRFALKAKYYRTGDASFFWKWWKNMHLKESQKVITICLSEIEKYIKENENRSICRNAITGLSYLMAKEEFKNFIVHYYPSGLQADAKTKENEIVYNIQQYICMSLKNLNPPSLAMESILMFCKGDYLKLVQRSLYSVCGNVNEDKLVPFLNVLEGRAVSTRKHAMHLAFRLLDKEQMYNLLNRFMKTEKNASIRRYIFEGIFNFFLLNADDYSWEMVKLNANEVDINDKEALEILMRKETIPHQYIVQYIVCTWNILNKLPDSDRNKESNKASLLRLITSNLINLFPKEFCDDIIEKYFFKGAGGSLELLVHAFTCKYIIYCDSTTEQEERLKSNFEVVGKYVLANWYKSGVRTYVGNFLKKFCSEFIDDGCENTKILIKFANLWNSLFKSHQAFAEYLQLQFTLIYVEKLTLPQIGQRIARLCDSLGLIYGFGTVAMFSERINYFGRYFVRGKDKTVIENWYILYENLIQPDNSVYCSVLVILLISFQRPTTSETRTKYESIIEILKKNLDPVVQLYLENHIVGGCVNFSN